MPRSWKILARLMDLNVIYLEEDVAQADAGGVGSRSINGEGDYGTVSDCLNVRVGSSLVQSRTQFLSRRKDGTKHGCGNPRLVVLSTRRQAALI